MNRRDGKKVGKRVRKATSVGTTEREGWNGEGAIGEGTRIWGFNARGSKSWDSRRGSRGR